MAATDRHVTYEQAATLLGISMRTLQRRIRGGQLATVTANGRQLVVLPLSTESVDKPEPLVSTVVVETDTPATPATVARITVLEVRVAELEADRDHWRSMAAKLSDTVTEQNRMIAAQMMERGRMIAAKTPREAPHAQPVTHTMPRTRRSLRALYMALRGSQRV